ncbi:UPF0223 family protein [Vaginisenegalia massiliensis]|uniref:UPF0223 family protein n=1 Tax=Vaginisenegalia massiliensis TaxID=2058294 RepID=UPI000F52EB65|nr:UPF0223 family protein [Vaginisenegalia massiliensis]
MEEYAYPLDPDWSTDEIVAVVNFLSGLEAAYEQGVEVTKFNHLYHEFKQVVPSKAEEKQIDKQFSQASGYSIYRAVQQMKAMLGGKPEAVTHKKAILKMERMK